MPKLLTKKNLASLFVIFSQLLFLIATAWIFFSDTKLIESIAFGVASVLFGFTVLTILIENKLRFI